MLICHLSSHQRSPGALSNVVKAACVGYNISFEWVGPRVPEPFENLWDMTVVLPYRFATDSRRSQGLGRWACHV